MNKVLFVILGLDFSGAEGVLLQYLNGNSEIDPYFVFVYKGNAKSQFEKYFEKRKIFELNIPYKKNELRFMPQLTQYRLAKEMLPIVVDLKPDIVYFNNTHEVILSRKIRKQIKIPCIGHVHDMQKSIGTFPKRYEAKCAFSELDRLLTVSEACKKSWNCSRMQVVYNGVKDDYFKEDILTDKDGDITIGFVGMLSDRKGFDILVRLMGEHEIKVNWMIAYNKVEKQYEDVIEQLREKSNIQFFNNIPGPEMKKFYDRLDILLIPSRQDPLPTVAIEAMARKVLVLGANTGGIPELVGLDEFLFETNDVSCVKEYILKYSELQRSELQKLSEKQYLRAYKIFRDSEKKKNINNIIMESASRKGEK